VSKESKWTASCEKYPFWTDLWFYYFYYNSNGFSILR
jgi:hypothetical protein